MKESLFQLFQQVIEKTNEKEKTFLKSCWKDMRIISVPMNLI